jgi:hypothetical protein
MNTVDVLRGAKALLSDPDRWSRGPTSAQDAKGLPVSPMYVGAVRWCALGALEQVGGTGDAFVHAHSVMCRTINGVVPTWNDDPNTTHADLIDAFDRAILCLAPETQAEPLEAVSA